MYGHLISAVHIQYSTYFMICNNNLLQKDVLFQEKYIFLILNNFLCIIINEMLTQTICFVVEI